MIKIKPPNYKYCPFCGGRLSIKEEDGEARKFCPSCFWVYYPHVGGSVLAVAMKKNKILLAKRARDPFKGTWMMPAGFIEYGEHPEL